MLEVGRPGGRPTCTDVHATVGWRAGRPTRSTDPVDRAGRPAESLLAVPEARSIGRSTAAPTVGFSTVAGRPTVQFWPQRLVFGAL